MGLDKKKLLAIFFLALIVRLILFAVLVDKTGTFNLTLGPQDTQGFINDARNLYSGNGFSDVAAPPFTPDGVRVPVVALILGLFGRYYGLYVILQILAASFTCVLLADLGARAFSARAGFWAGVVLALDPLVIFHSQVILSETWFAFFLVLAVWLFIRFWEEKDGVYRWLTASAFVLGVATLTRPVGAALFMVFILALLFFSKTAMRARVKHVVIFTAVVAAVISPWLVRNHTTFDAWSLSYIPAYNWYHFNARVFYSNQQGISKGEAKSLFYQRAEEERLRQGFGNEFQMRDFYLREARQVISASPGGYLIFHGLNTSAVLLTGTFDDLNKVLDENYRDLNITSQVLRGWDGIKQLAVKNPANLAEKAFLLLCYLVILCGFLLTFSKREVWKRFVFLAVLAFLLAATTGAVAEGRFRVPAEPFLILLFVQSVSEVYRAMNLSLQERSRV